MQRAREWNGHEEREMMRRDWGCMVTNCVWNEKDEEMIWVKVWEELETVGASSSNLKTRKTKLAVRIQTPQNQFMLMHHHHKPTILSLFKFNQTNYIKKISYFYVFYK